MLTASLESDPRSEGEMNQSIYKYIYIYCKQSSLNFFFVNKPSKWHKLKHLEEKNSVKQKINRSAMFLQKKSDYIQKYHRLILMYQK